MDFTPETLKRLELLSEKYTAMGQDMNSYLDGLLHADFLTYWDYIHLDTLLSLQNPKTLFPDEQIFVLYHQITELYFKLTINAIEQVAFAQNLTASLLKRQLDRVNCYFTQLINSFDIMVDGMDKDEFLQFRMSLLPASGFQSGQYRTIELMSTDTFNLVHYTERGNLNADLPKSTLYDALYWKRGATELATGKKTLTLKQFENKYAEHFVKTAEKFHHCNLWQCYLRLSPEDQQDPALIAAYQELDLNANVRWNLSHYRSAVRHLERKPADIAATGGTNWQQYLPPKNQRIIFFPSLWSEEELDNWGKRM